ncbi:sensor histidine kinase [Clostridium sp. YIM B02569]|uniref:sensor histidine kinase n=1 Tax=Clostridium sp. YIM B02569 TaxID=2911967 RepID=UPI001EECBA6E|nr:sensor histidine kinase [Clostridium sp. YIM B02569]
MSNKKYFYNMGFNHIKKASFKTKLISSFLILSILPIISIEIFSYYYSTNKIENKISRLMDFSLTQSAKSINTTLSSYEDLDMQIASDDELTKLIDKYDIGSNMDINTQVALNDIKGKLTVYAYSKLGIVNIDIRTNKNHKIASYNRINGHAIPDIWKRYDDIIEKNDYEDETSRYGTIWSGMSYTQPLVEETYNLINVYSNIIDFTSDRIIGVLCISINEDVLQKTYNLNSDDLHANNINVYSLIIDNEGTIVSYEDRNYIGKNIYYLANKKDRNSEDLNNTIINSHIVKGNSLIVNTKSLKISNWYIVNIIDENKLFSEVNLSIRIIIIVIFIVILFFIFFIVLVSNRLTSSIREIVAAMKKAQKGELSVRIEEDITDEFSIIALTFNKMISHINELVEKLRIQMNLTSEAVKLQKEAEIRAIEAQINPHFLYNTLDCINWMAIEKEEYEISKMLKSLGQILRYSINQSNKIVSFSQEIQWLKQYLYLQESRFDNSFKTEIKFDKEVPEFKIHKLMLQPLIENSIIHGFEGYTSGGILEVSIEMKEADIVIFIKDNGKGMDGEKVKYINSLVSEAKIINKGEHIGIENVISRLRIYYGDYYKFNIESEIDRGTSICIRIPKIK